MLKLQTCIQHPTTRDQSNYWGTVALVLPVGLSAAFIPIYIIDNHNFQFAYFLCQAFSTYIYFDHWPPSCLDTVTNDDPALEGHDIPQTACFHCLTHEL